MGSPTSTQLLKTEVELVLQSGLFAKAPRLERFFRYICERYLEGDGDGIKEYSIAIEALGRSSDFDPKKNSIVRVEAHRLRKRLEEYYRGPGAAHPVHISIPNGQYQPCFALLETAPQETAVQEFGTIDLVSIPQVAPRPLGPLSTRWFRLTVLALAGTGLLGAVFFLHRPRSKPAATAKPLDEIWAGKPATAAMPSEFRMLAGYHGPAFMDYQGHAWMADAFYRGGVSTPVALDRLNDAPPYTQLVKAQRSGKFQYDIPLRQTTHELHLYLMENEYGRGNPKGGGEATRAFQVSVNGQVKLKFLDPLAAAGGPNRLYQSVFKDISPAPDGVLHLAFDPITGPALLNAIEILPSPPGRIRPVRIVAQENPVTDSEGRLWAADQYFLGGTAVFRKNAVTNCPDALYQGERYGNFSYRIPVAPGKYRLTLHFAETWFGTPESRAPAPDSRIFNVFVNGVALLRDYQVAKDAGGPNRGVQKVFDDLQPNAQGMLLLEFVPVENYAEVNAIEVVETG